MVVFVKLTVWPAEMYVLLGIRVVSSAGVTSITTLFVDTSPVRSVVFRVTR